MITKAIDLFRSRRWLATGLAALFCTAMAPLGEAADLCFLAFDGGFEFQFKTTQTRLKAPGEKNLAGRFFGAATAPCGGLNQWPVTGTAVTTGSQILLGFRTMNVDAGACGAVDYIVTLDPRTLSGSLQLHNDRVNFSNTSTFTPVACAPPPSADQPASLIAGEDPQGNIAH